MKKSLIISETDNIAALLENDRVVEFFVNRGELLLGDIYTATVENILPGIDAAFVNLGKDKMGFLHANDVPGQGALKEKLVPKQKLLVQITKEPTGHKGPRVSTAISLPGRFLVLVPEERGVSISRRISEAKERSRLKAVVNLMKPPGIGLIIRTEAKGQGEQELFEDFEQLWDRWQTIVSDGEASIGPTLIYRDQDLLFRVIRDAYSHDVSEIVVDTSEGLKRATDYLAGWAGRSTKIVQHVGEEPLLITRGVDKEIEAALSDRAELPSGGHLNIQPTEALTVIDVNSGRFTSSRTQAETVRRTNLEAAQEIPRQLRLRNIGGMVIVDFIDMDSRRDQQQVLEQFQRALEDDRAKPQIGQLSDLGLVELTRRRQGQSLRELFAGPCPTCAGLGVVPSLEVGSGDQKRIITFKPKEDDVVRGRQKRGAKQQQVLRAVSAGGGRVKPTLIEPEEEEEALDEVPVDILEQVPDDLLAGHERGFKKDFGLGDEDEVPVETVKPSTDKPDFFVDEDDEDDLPAADATVISERFDAADVDEDEEAEESPYLRNSDVNRLANSSYAPPFVVEEDEDEQPFDAITDEAVEAEEEEEILPPPPEPESLYETEMDPVTGVFRLKAKSNQGDERSEESQSSGGHMEWGQAAAQSSEQQQGWSEERSGGSDELVWNTPASEEAALEQREFWGTEQSQLELPLGQDFSNDEGTVESVRHEHEHQD